MTRSPPRGGGLALYLVTIVFCPKPIGLVMRPDELVGRMGIVIDLRDPLARKFRWPLLDLRDHHADRGSTGGHRSSR
ncbi:MAG: hypothetical protein V3V08_26055 [Nannocystaceae bacterium]